VLHHIHLTAFFRRTTWVSWQQKGRTILDFIEERDDEWHQLDDNMQIICTLLQTDNHTSTSSLGFYRPGALLSAQPTTSEH